ncbi:MAG: hypothetical protein ABIO49_00995 [Dokdonella sp.]
MNRAPLKVPLPVLVQGLALGIVVGTPVLFIAFNQVRRACGSRLWGSREHFCSAHDLWIWLLSFPAWSYGIFPLAIIAVLALIRRFLRGLAS